MNLVAVETGWYEKAGLLYLLCLEHVDNLGAYTASRPETGLLIPSVCITIPVTTYSSVPRSTSDSSLVMQV